MQTSFQDTRMRLSNENSGIRVFGYTKIFLMRVDCFVEKFPAGREELLVLGKPE